MRRLLSTVGICLSLIAAGSAFAAPIQGGFSLNTTRVIYSAGAHYAGVTMQNTSALRILAQPYISPLNDTSKKSPFFTVTPTVVSLDSPYSDQPDIRSKAEVRIMYLGGTLPQDRETAFHFVARSATASDKPSEGENDKLSVRVPVAMGTVIKFFWRPQHLGMSSAQAMASLRFGVSPGGSIKVVNPSPYYVTMLTLSKDNIRGKNKSMVNFDMTEGGAYPHMLAPFSERTYPLSVKAGDAVVWQAVSDLGGAISYKGVVQASVMSPNSGESLK